jgi:hypothetical protein
LKADQPAAVEVIPPCPVTGGPHEPEWTTVYAMKCARCGITYARS